MMPMSMVLAFFSAQLDALRRESREDSERGSDLVTMVVMISLMVAAAIVIVGILVAKATEGANNVQVQ